ncbi:hypothetical protein, partial [uncultured Sphingomonas sp.]|uniref:hypothetical protein n=1 Tax=uncultured Sphingomonas sp. TaxID=158754 RepID=UPI0025ED4E8E
LLPVNVAVDIQAAYTIGDGRLSPWSASSTVSTSTAALAPAPVTGLSATGAAGKITLEWRNPTSSNLASVRIYRATSNSFGAATMIEDRPAALGATDSYDSVAASGTYWHWIATGSAAGVVGASQPFGSATIT